MTISTVVSAGDVCISAYEETQSLRKDGHLVGARDRAVECARGSCPKALTKDCTRWIAELDEAIPSISLSARGSDGTDLSDVAVQMDGQPLVQRLDGKSVPVDPGSHKLVFTRDGSMPVDMVVLVHEGEKSRPITATLKTTVVAPPPPPVQPPADTSPSRPIPAGAVVAGVITLVGVGLGTGFGIHGLMQKSDLDGCKPRCVPGDVDSMMRSLSIADVSFAVAGAALLATVYLVLTRPVVKPSPVTTALLLGRF